MKSHLDHTAYPADRHRSACPLKASPASDLFGIANTSVARRAIEFKHLEVDYGRTNRFLAFRGDGIALYTTMTSMVAVLRDDEPPRSSSPRIGIITVIHGLSCTDKGRHRVWVSFA